jgi:hypothetical protein
MNLARAKALGLAVPLTIQKIADMAITFSDVCFWG